MRQTWPAAIIYANEGYGVLVSGGYQGSASSYDSTKPRTVENGWVSDDQDWRLPAELDLVSMDHCAHSRRPTASVVCRPPSL